MWHHPVDQEDFVKFYIRELSHYAQITGNRTVNSIFFGGGTPSLMTAKTVSTLINAIHDHWSVATDVEISLEANPSSVDASRFYGYKDAGVNRLSIGVQSLRDDALKFLARLHNGDEARHAIHLARTIFERISFDLIYARPGQSPYSWQLELEEAIALSADHLSLYQLTIEPETPFYGLQRAGKLHIPQSEQAAQLYEVTLDVTARNGLPAYEISNHAKPGFECRHNLVYWRYGDYVGVGPGAHGRLTTEQGKLASAGERQPKRWAERVDQNEHGAIALELLSNEAVGDEMLLMGMRLKEGIDPVRYQTLSGKMLDMESVNHLQRKGMLNISGNNLVSATQNGWLVLNTIIAEISA